MVGDYIKMTRATAFDFSGQMSVECWFKLSAAVNWGVFYFLKKRVIDFNLL